MRKGESWSSDMPDGLVVTYTVVGFGKDEQDRQFVEIHRIVKHPKNVNPLEEQRRTYVLGVGEVKRITTQLLPNGTTALMEMKLLEGAVPTKDKDKNPKEKDPDPFDK